MAAAPSLPSLEHRPLAVGERLELERVDPAHDVRRSYVLAVIVDPQLPLFEGEPPALVLVVAWGRLGQRRRVLRRRFADAAALERELRRLRALRDRHGYREVAR